MAQIHNSDLFKELRDGIKNQQLADSIPNQIADKVVPVMEVNPKLLRRINICKSSVFTETLGANMYTTPTDRDFFLTNLSCSWVKDITATTLTIVIEVVVKGGVTTPVLTFNTTTLTVERDQQNISFPIPIQLEKGSQIVVKCSTNVANVDGRVNIQGYTVDNPNA